MAQEIDVSDEQIIKSLKRKEHEHLSAINKAKQTIVQSERTLKVIRDALAGYKKLGETTSASLMNGEISSKSFEIPREYSKNLTWAQKIMFVIQKKKGGFVGDVVAELEKLEPGIKRAKQAVTFYCSSLKSEGYLKFEKVGIKYRYYM